MMNKMKSAGVHIVKFLFILPMIAVLLLAFRNQYERKQQGAGISPSTQDTLPATKRIIKKMPAEIASISVMETNDAAVSDPIKQKVQGMVVVKRKDGTKEVYDLDSKESLDAFEKKYGVKLEDILPPPPPPPPIPPAESVPVIAPVPPTPPVPAVGSTEAVAPVTPVPPVKNTGIDLSGISREYEITDKKAWIKLLDGTVENYDLTNKKEKEAFEKKYGKIIHVNVNANVNANVYAKVNANVNANVNSNPNTTIKTNVNTNINNDLRKTVELSSDAVTTRPVRAISTTPAAARNSNLRSMVSPAVLYTTPAPPSSGDPINDYGYTITGKEDIVITITKNSTRQDLDKFIVQMKEKGVELSFDETEYNSKGQLVSINGTMKSGGSQSNFVATDFERLVLAMIRKGDKIYFKVSTRDSKTVI